MTTIDNKYNTIAFDDDAKTVTVTHKPPRNSRKKVEYGPVKIPYGAIEKGKVLGTGFKVRAYGIILKNPPTKVAINVDLYGVWLYTQERDTFMEALDRASKHKLDIPWKAPELNTWQHRLDSDSQKRDALAQAAASGRRYPFGELCITGGGVLTYKGHEFPVDGARATIDHDGVKQKVGAGRVIGGAVLAGPAGAIVGGMAKKNKGEIALTVQLADGRAISTTGPVKQLKQAQDVAERINDAGLGI